MNMIANEPQRGRPPFVVLMRKIGLEPDPWQQAVLECDQHRLLLNCSRQAGKSTVVAILALVQALWDEGTLVLILSRSYRQSSELFQRVVEYHRRLGSRLLDRCTAEELRFKNMSRIVCLPCKEETIRGYANVGVLIIDEAARVPDELFRAVSPMLAVSNGRMICLSTPFGKRGFFYQAWAHGGADWHRIEVPAERISRISPEYLQCARRTMGEAAYRQEFCCSFEGVEGLVYPGFARRATGGTVQQERLARANGRKVGGIDFGFRNPFAAVWGVLDHDDILWLTGEHYSRQKPLSYHAQHLPREVTWYADPAGAGEISELRCAGFVVNKGNNALRTGIAAVTARLGTGRLRVCSGWCPNLLAEAELYRYPGADEGGSETPVDEHNHALAALRYLVSRIDANKMARFGWFGKKAPPPEPPAQRKWLSIWNEALWTDVGRIERSW